MILEWAKRLVKQRGHHDDFYCENDCSFCLAVKDFDKFLEEIEQPKGDNKGEK